MEQTFNYGEPIEQSDDAGGQDKRPSILSRVGKIIANIFFIGTLLLLVLLIIGMMFHVKPMVVYSGSMVPTFSAGDIVIVKQTPVSQVKPGDIVTFHDPTRDGDIVSHRLVSQTPNQTTGKYDMVTKGDANSGQEEWSIARDGLVGKHYATIPKIGYGLNYLQNPAINIALLGGAILMLLIFFLVQIWKPRPEEDLPE